MRAAGAVVAAIALVAVAGCGGQSHARRDAVNAYFDRVEAVQGPVQLQSAQIAKAFADFSTVRASRKETAALVHAYALLARVDHRLAALRPPAEARRMHVDLVHLYAVQAGVADELVRMTRFIPAYRRILAPVQPAHAVLSSDLKAAKGWRPIAAAFARYRVALDGVLHKLGRLDAPPTLRPSFDTQRRALRASVSACTSIESALARQDAKATALAINRLSTLGADSSLLKAQRAQIAATKAYNARLAEVAALQQRIGRERQKLVEALG